MFAPVCCAGTQLTHNSFVLLKIQPQICLQLWDRSQTVEMWPWDWSALLQVGSVQQSARLFTAAALSIWCLLERWHNQSTSWSLILWSEQHIQISEYFYMRLKMQTQTKRPPTQPWSRQEEVIISQMLPLLGSNHFCSKRRPTGDRDHSSLGGDHLR